jgi:hypothetical protein
LREGVLRACAAYQQRHAKEKIFHNKPIK